MTTPHPQAPQCEAEGCASSLPPTVTTRDNRAICPDCREADLDNAASAYLVGPGSAPDGGTYALVRVGDMVTEDIDGDPSPMEFTRHYVHTDGWRGYHQTNIVGWTEVAEGWTTGWPDDTTRRKVTFNDWIQSLLDGTHVPPVGIAVICDSTSNVFSTATGIHVRDDDIPAFEEWMSTQSPDLDGLKAALR
jgi:hypothetical protein